MIERGRRPEIPSGSFIDIYRHDNLSQINDDPQMQDALALLRQGIWELRDISGMDITRLEKSKYTPAKCGPIDPEKETTFEDFWTGVKSMNREPFLMVDRNLRDGIVGVLEGREYTFAGTGEKAIFVNWVVMRNSGSNDDDHYSYRGRQVADRLYNKLEEMGRANDVKLLIAGVNTLNSASARFHERMGFVNEQFAGQLSPDGKQFPHATEKGAFIAPYPIHGIDSQGNPINAQVNVYTKRIQ